MGQCSAIGDGSSRFLLTVTAEGELTVAYTQKTVNYEGTACEGTGTATDQAAPLGTLVFSPTEAAGDVTFNRGDWTLPSGTTQKAVWVLERPDLLCILADSDPTVFPDGEGVASAVEVLQDDFCYERQ
jgi:hypothetical protein